MVDANPKGIDREMFLVLRSLGLQVGVKPVLDRATLEQRKPNTDDHYVLACESTRDVDVEAPGGANKREALDRHEQLWGASILAVRKEAEVESRLPRLVHNPSPLDDETMAYRTFSQRLEEIITTRQIRGLPVWEPPPFGVDRVGHSFDVDVVDHDCHLGDDSVSLLYALMMDPVYSTDTSD